MENPQIKVVVFYTLLALYHIPEYMVYRHFHPKETTYKNFLISYQYLVFLLFSMLEVAISQEFLDEFHESVSYYTTLIGLGMVIIGNIIRACAIFQLGENYSHYSNIRPYQKDILITNGIFSLMRHPCYVAFFLIQIGAQIYIQNIVSTIVFSIKLHSFFAYRIKMEERILLKHHPEEYTIYKSRVKFGCF